MIISWFIELKPWIWTVIIYLILILCCFPLFFRELYINLYNAKWINLDYSTNVSVWPPIPTQFQFSCLMLIFLPDVDFLAWCQYFLLDPEFQFSCRRLTSFYCWMLTSNFLAGHCLLNSCWILSSNFTAVCQVLNFLWDCDFR